jgi:Tfp pilus assembly protein PilX
MTGATMMPSPFPRPPRTSRPQQGVVLIVVLIMLVAIAFMSVGVMRGALSTDLQTNNARTQTLANEAAQLALRLCEDDIRKVGSSTTPVLFTDTPAILAPSTATRSNGTILMAWEDKTKWIGTAAVAKTLTDAQMRSSNSAFAPATLPQCLAEYSPGTNTSQVIVLTVRAFSPDYTEDSNNRVTSGSVVWLQSRFLLASGS